MSEFVDRLQQKLVERFVELALETTTIIATLKATGLTDDEITARLANTPVCWLGTTTEEPAAKPKRTRRRTTRTAKPAQQGSTRATVLAALEYFSPKTAANISEQTGLELNRVATCLSRLANKTGEAVKVPKEAGYRRRHPTKEQFAGGGSKG